MAAPLATYSEEEEERSVIRFLSSEGMKPIKIHRRMKVRYGDARPQRLSCIRTAQRGDGMQVFQVRRRGAASGARVAALSVKRIFFF